MIDTFVFELHNQKKHKEIWIECLKEGFYSRAFKTTFLFENQISIKSPQITFNSVASGDFKNQTDRFINQVHIPSSHYFINISVNPDFIRFDFSIPKYLYGNNVAMFIRSTRNKNFRINQDSEFLNHTDYVYNQLKKFIENFFAENFVDMPLDICEIIVKRIDICYNQVFDSKDLALKYLNYQRRIKKKYQRDKSDRFDNYATGLSYRGEGYYFKIYHKGSDYSRHDRPKHEKINKILNKDYNNLSEKDQLYYDTYLRGKNLNKSFFQTEFLQNLADKILRYEITYRPAQMSKYYKKDVFCKNDIFYQKDFRIYKKYLNKVGKKFDITVIPNNYRQKFLDMHQIQRKRHDFYLFDVQTENLSFSYMLEKIKQGIKIKDNTDLIKQEKYFHYGKDIKGAYFSLELFRSLVNEFWSLVNDFQIKELPVSETLREKIIEHNQKVEVKRKYMAGSRKVFDSEKLRQYSGKRINYNKIRGHILAIEKYGSIDMWAAAEPEINKRTMQRYKAELKSLGIIKNSIPEPIDFRYNISLRDYLYIENVHYDRLKNTIAILN
jgi:hypothetical protein